MNSPFDEHFAEEETVPNTWSTRPAGKPRVVVSVPEHLHATGDNFSEQWADAGRLMAHQERMLEDALRFGANWGIGRIHDEIHLEQLNITPETARAALASFEAAWPTFAKWRDAEERIAKRFSDSKPFGISPNLRKGNADMGIADRPGQIEIHASDTIEQIRAKLPPIKLVLGNYRPKAARDKLMQVVRQRTTLVHQFNAKPQQEHDEQGIPNHTNGVIDVYFQPKYDGANNAQMLDRRFRVPKYNAQGIPIHIPVKIVDMVELGTQIHSDLQARYKQIDKDRFYDTQLGIPYTVDGVLSEGIGVLQSGGSADEPFDVTVEFIFNHKYEKDGTIMRSQDQCAQAEGSSSDPENIDVTNRIRLVGLEGINVSTQFTTEMLKLAHWNCSPGLDRAAAIDVKSEIDQLVGSVAQTMDRIRNLRQRLIGINVEGSHRKAA